MRLTLTRYLMAVLCMAAAGTWILPIRTLAAPTPVLTSSGEEIRVALEMLEEIDSMRNEGLFDHPAYVFNSADLTGDGVSETIEVRPSQRLETQGTMRVVDGVSGRERYSLHEPDGEMGVGSLAAVVEDCDSDGLQDVAIWSWLDASETAGSPATKLRIRVFSGDSGELIGLLEANRELGSRVSMADFEVVVAGDVNHDQVLDIEDVTSATAAMCADAALAPALDFKMDGALTVDELAEVVDRVTDESTAMRVSLHEYALRNLAVTQPIAPPGSGINPVAMGGGGAGSCAGWQGGWDCWIDLAIIVGDFALMAARMAKCAGPLVTICLVKVLCELARIIASLIEFVDECFRCNGAYPWWMEGILNLTQAIGWVCEGIEMFSQQLKVKICKGIRDLLRGLGNLRIAGVLDPNISQP